MFPGVASATAAATAAKPTALPLPPQVVHMEEPVALPPTDATPTEAAPVANGLDSHTIVMLSHGLESMTL
jgi:hypothetical protein